ncbi:Structure-specific endonuclease subunit [Trichinella pseudospiralis]|uniref:Structure-specific endonuclease subunit SLX4 n=1 Tax=Trichinella pseudospiralis TaxID=6337 RepID=A0A0V1FZ77_TRIPS|nr:Structure-specific endonuclease subunit SLX4 [Trichinella pseudospiralis]
MVYVQKFRPWRPLTHMERKARAMGHLVAFAVTSGALCLSVLTLYFATPSPSIHFDILPIDRHTFGSNYLEEKLKLKLKMFDEHSEKVESMRFSTVQDSNSLALATLFPDESHLDESGEAFESRNCSSFNAVSSEKINHCLSCGKDISNYTDVQCQQHLNSCLDSKEKKAAFQQAEEKWNLTIDCPLCNEPLPPGPFRQTHLKRCGNAHNLPASELCRLVQIQESIADSKKRSGLQHTKLKKPNINSAQFQAKKRDKQTPKTAFDEQIQLAQAISLSLTERNSHFETAKPQARQLKQSRLPTKLQLTSAETQIDLLKDRLVILLSRNDSNLKLTLENDRLAESLWWYADSVEVYCEPEKMNDSTVMVSQNMDVICDVEMENPDVIELKRDPDREIKFFSERRLENFCADMLNLLENAKLADVNIFCGENDSSILMANSIILQVRCPTFFQMAILEEDKKYSIFCPDVSRTVMESFLRYLYFADEGLFHSQCCKDLVALLNRFNPTGWAEAVKQSAGMCTTLNSINFIDKEVQTDIQDFEICRCNNNDSSSSRKSSVHERATAEMECSLVNDDHSMNSNSYVNSSLAEKNCSVVVAADDFGTNESDCMEMIEFINDEGYLHKNVTTPRSHAPSSGTPLAKARKRLLAKYNKLQTPVVKNLSRDGITVLKIGDVTPAPNYTAMSTPQIQESLQRFGLRPLPKRKAVNVLRRIYNETHPFIKSDGSYEVKEEEECAFKKRKRMDKSQKTDQVCSTQHCHTDAYNMLSDKEVFSLEESFIPKECEDDNEEKDLHQNLTDAISRDLILYEQILTYSPINLKETLQRLKQNGVKCSLNSLMNYFDEQCITFVMKEGTDFKA